MDFLAHLARTDRAVQTLGETVLYSPGVGDPVEVTGIFDAVYRKVDVGIPGVSSSGPAVWLLLADLPSDPTTDGAATVTIREVEYKSHETEPDGQGTVRLMLHEA